jgi:hypothetical protein
LKNFKHAGTKEGKYNLFYKKGEKRYLLELPEKGAGIIWWIIPKRVTDTLI